VPNSVGNAFSIAPVTDAAVVGDPRSPRPDADRVVVTSGTSVG